MAHSLLVWRNIPVCALKGELYDQRKGVLYVQLKGVLYVQLKGAVCPT